LADNGNGADSDPDSDTLTVTAVNGSTANIGNQFALASGALLTLNANGTFAYNPNGKFETLSASQSATDTFTYTLNDGNGGTSTATVTLTIQGVNDAPTLANTLTNQTATEDTSFSFIVPANTFADVDAGDTLT
jgi:VCBS repeat-containing protein